MKYIEYICITVLFTGLVITYFLYSHYMSLMGSEMGLAKVNATITSLFSFRSEDQPGFIDGTRAVTEHVAVLNGLLVVIGASIITTGLLVFKRIMFGWYKLFAGLVCYGIIQVIGISFFIYKYEIWKIT